MADETLSELSFPNAQRILRAYAQRGDILFGERVDEFLEKFAVHVVEQLASPALRKQMKPGMTWQQIAALLPDMSPDFVAAKASIVPIKDLTYEDIAEIVKRDLKGNATEAEIDALCSCYEYLDTWRRLLAERRGICESRIEIWEADLALERVTAMQEKKLQSIEWLRKKGEVDKRVARERAVWRSLVARQAEVKQYRQSLTQQLARHLLSSDEPFVFLKKEQGNGGEAQNASEAS